MSVIERRSCRIKHERVKAQSKLAAEMTLLWHSVPPPLGPTISQFRSAWQQTTRSTPTIHPHHHQEPFLSRTNSNIKRCKTSQFVTHMPSNNTSAPPPQPDYIYRPEDPEYTDPSQPTSGLSQRYHQLSTTMEPNEIKTLTRMQILTPLSVLLQMGVMILCGSKLISPNLQQVSRRHPTYLSPQDSFVLFYWAILYVLLIGFSVFLLLSRTPDTKKALVHGVGTRLALANYMMVLWAIFWILDRPLTFVLGTAALGVIALVLLFNALVLAVKYPPSAKHPLDWLFIHVPIKMFLVITIQYDVWQQLFMALGWDFGSGGHEALLKGLWPAFGIITGLGSVFGALDLCHCRSDVDGRRHLLELGSAVAQAFQSYRWEG